MVVGNGLLAEAFLDYEDNPDIVIFASGVSNSLENENRAFQRERDLMLSTIKNNNKKTFIYFSTCSIYDKTVEHRPYVIHKLDMENLIQEKCNKYLVLRLPNIIGFGGNERTILNYFVNNIKNGKIINLWTKATRNLLDVEDLLSIFKIILDNYNHNKVLNVAHVNSFYVLEIVRQVEVFLGKTARLNLIDKGNSMVIDVSEIKQELLKVITQKKQSIDYIALLLEKYY
jgi:nucleoside-diphosphate-sugar epimerase